ncbi:MAG: hypothetical protein VYE27_00080 [Pseudomonadota bacterium]|nr:hypothetical protein [Pseudomonadota bacterium]
MKNSTFTQIKDLKINVDNPILIVDADEVLVLFAAHFSGFLNKLGWTLNLKGYRLDDAIINVKDGHTADKRTYQFLINSFIDKETLHQPEAPGASEALKLFRTRAQIIILSNVPKSAYQDRLKNLNNLDMNYPVIQNNGFKGPALKEIEKLTKNLCIFIDDNPYQIQSAADYVPSMYRFHFTACDIVKATMPIATGATHRPSSWPEVAKLIDEILP